MDLLNMKCCGVKEIHGLSGCETPQGALTAFGDLTYFFKIPGADGKTMMSAPRENFRYVVFAQATYNPSNPRNRVSYGEKFAALIKDSGLGTVLETTANVNPNSGNHLKVWIWTIDHEATKKLCQKLKKVA